MRGGILHHGPSSRASRPLVVRGGLACTFGGLASFLALTFLCAGTYVLADAMDNPIEAQAAALIAGAFTITLASVLLFFLFWPGKSRRIMALRNERDASAPGSRPTPSEASSIAP